MATVNTRADGAPKQRRVVVDMFEKETLLKITSDIIASYVTGNTIAAGDVAPLVRNVHAALQTLGSTPEAPKPDREVDIAATKASNKPSYLVCLECGKKHMMLKRHLLTAHGLTPDAYRRQFGLPATYPMVARNYAQLRSELAKQIGLGTRHGRAGKLGRTMAKK